MLFLTVFAPWIPYKRLDSHQILQCFQHYLDPWEVSKNRLFLQPFSKKS